MRRLGLLFASLALAVLPAPGRAGTAPSRPQILLMECPTRASLRASLFAYADSIAPHQPAYAGQALYFAGLSYARASERDSAIACFGRANKLRGDEPERLALVDALLLRLGDGDLDAALALLEAATAQARAESSPAAYAFQARLAWAELLAGRKERSFEMFRELQEQLDLDPVWGYRMARSFYEAGDVKRALGSLQPLAIASRLHDAEVMDLAAQAFSRFGDRSRLEGNFRREVAIRDQSEGTLAKALGGRRVRFTAGDGFALGGVAVIPPGEKRRRAAIVLWSPRDTLESYDSLAVALRSAGWAVLLMQVRGSGWSAGPACPFPDSWAGREDAMQATCAGDVREGFRALRLVANIDTTRYLVGGVGLTGPIAVEAAQLDERAQAMVLLSPSPAEVERGTVRERIRRLKMPIYFANAPEDFLQFETTEALYQAGDRPRSRVADVKGAGTGARPFRRDTPAVKRLVTWLDETVPEKGRAKPRSAAPPR